MTGERANLVVGGGMTGLLVARELIRAGESVTVVERGRRDLGRDDLPTEQRQEDLPTTRHNTESVPSQGGQRWQYAYALGGSTLLWAGVAPRLLPSDFEMRTRYGIWRDWPIGYSDLVPYYKLAERTLGVSGRPSEIFPESDAYEVEPPPPSSTDRLLGPLLQPFETLPLARTRFGWGNPEGDDAQWSALNLARELDEAAGFELLDGHAAARLLVRGDRIGGVECIRADGEREEITAGRVILTANGIENAALLLRSGLGDPPVGRNLGDHTHISLELELAEPVDHQAETRDSGASYAWVDGPWRAERAAAVLIPYNHGMPIRGHLAEALAAGGGGTKLRRELAERFARTAVVYLSLEDAPREDRFVTLSDRRDGLGLPLTQVHYPQDSEYVQRGLRTISGELEERLRPLGARIVRQSGGGLGGHMLGTCAMGPDGVVDENLRHHRLTNLYVAGGSAFPTHSPMHPTLTIAALGIRLGRHLAGTTD